MQTRRFGRTNHASTVAIFGAAALWGHELMAATRRSAADQLHLRQQTETQFAVGQLVDFRTWDVGVGQ